jgi:uncharacterized radical SAM protein YgiQ
LRTDHSKQTALLKAMKNIEGIKRVIVASGIRYDMILADKAHGTQYLEEIVRHHVSGQMKIAPEHTEDNVLEIMGKPGKSELLAFRKKFYEITGKAGKKQFLTYYIIAAHPGCREKDMKALKKFASQELHARMEQVQIFTPTPSTYSTLMYWTEKDPFTGEPCFVEKNVAGKERQKKIMTGDVKRRR